MIIGDMVQVKTNGRWLHGEIIHVYVIPNEWSMVDLRLNNGDIIYGVSGRDIYGV